MRARLGVCLGLVLVAGCGGSHSTVPAILQDSAVSAASKAVPLYNVRYTANIGGPIAYDADENLAVVAIGPQLWTLKGSALSIELPASDPSRVITGLAYSHALRALVFSSSTAIYQAALKGGAVATVASGFRQIETLTTDASGNPYVVDYDHVASVQSGRPDPITAPGTIPNPRGMVPSPAIVMGQPQTLYVADAMSDVIHKVTTTGTISTLAGDCYPQPPGGPAPCWPGNTPGVGPAAVFAQPDGIAFDQKNQLLYVTDLQNSEIWKVAPDGNAAPVAGFGAPLFIDGDGFFAFIDSPRWETYNAQTGDIYFAETASHLHGTYVTATLRTIGPTPAPAANPVARFPAPSIPSGPQGISTAPDQSAWLVEAAANKILHVGNKGNIAEFKPPLLYDRLQTALVDASGNAWISGNFGELSERQPALIEVDASGSKVSGHIIIDSVSANGNIGGTALGPDGNIWFTVSDSDGGAVGLIDATTGAITQYRIGEQPSAPQPGAIATGPDGDLWFFLSSNGGTPAMGRITTSGQLLTSISLPSLPAPITKMAQNPADELMWWVDDNRYVGSISQQGIVKAYAIDDGRGAPMTAGISVGPDGTLWVPETNYADVAQVTISGGVTRYWLPKAPDTASARSDGSVWAASPFGETYLLNPKAYDHAGFPHP